MSAPFIVVLYDISRFSVILMKEFGIGSDDTKPCPEYYWLQMSSSVLQVGVF